MYEFVRTPAEADPPGSAGKPATPEVSARAWKTEKLEREGNLTTAGIQQQRDHQKRMFYKCFRVFSKCNLLQMRTATCSPYPSTDSRETSGPR